MTPLRRMLTGTCAAWALLAGLPLAAADVAAPCSPTVAVRRLPASQRLELYRRCDDARALLLQEQSQEAQRRGRAWAWEAPLGGALLGVAGGVAWGQTRSYDGPANGYYGDEGTFKTLNSALGAIAGGIGGGLAGLSLGLPLSIRDGLRAKSLAKQAADAYDHAADQVMNVSFQPLAGGGRLSLKARF